MQCRTQQEAAEQRQAERVWGEWAAIHIEEVLSWTDEAELANNQRRFQEGYLHARRSSETCASCSLSVGWVLGVACGFSLQFIFDAVSRWWLASF